MNLTMKRNLALLSHVIGLQFPLAALAAGPQTPGDAPPPVSAARLEARDQLERRFDSVSTLIETSSAAKQIEASTAPAAQAKRQQARELKQQAEQVYRAGNQAEASRLLDQASKVMMEGVRLAAPEQVTQEKKQRDFNSRMESVKALLAAQKRISIEKNEGAKGKEISNKIESQMQEANALAAAKQLDQGRALLDQAYDNAKKAIESMRDGATLVRSLDFATKEEEYRYEIDRNDSHQMLVKVLLDEKRASNPSLDGVVQKYVEQAGSLRKSAEGAAAKGDHVTGIRLLEDSTKELVRAIRGAGVYIPG
jgi:tetratricopeptide (TPR) repeat protein